MTALATAPPKFAVPARRLDDRQQEPRRLRLLSSSRTPSRLDVGVFESWDRALKVSERALDEVGAAHILSGSELVRYRRHLMNERRWFARLIETGSYEPLPGLRSGAGEQGEERGRDDRRDEPSCVLAPAVPVDDDLADVVQAGGQRIRA
jgi:hypothetical protein